ncbi:MAG: hypothetical protein WCA23_19040 [Stellaceae bacterium]
MRGWLRIGVSAMVTGTAASVVSKLQQMKGESSSPLLADSHGI